MKNLTTLGDYIRKSREAAGLTQAQLAERVGLSRPSITQIERGQVRYPKTQLLAAIASAVNVPVARLLSEAGLTLPETVPSQLHWLSTQLDEEGNELFVELGHALLRVCLRRRGMALQPAARP